MSCSVASSLTPSFPAPFSPAPPHTGTSWTLLKGNNTKHSGQRTPGPSCGTPDREFERRSHRTEESGQNQGEQVGTFGWRNNSETTNGSALLTVCTREARFACLAVCMSVRLHIQFSCLSAFLSVCMSAPGLFDGLPVFMSVCWSPVNQSVGLSVRVSCLPACLFVSV